AATAHSTAEFASGICGECERGLVEHPARIVVVLHLDAVVGVDPLSIGDSQRIRSPIIVEYERNTSGRPIKYLSPDSGRFIEFAIGLPAIHDPGLDLQFLGR